VTEPPHGDGPVEEPVHTITSAAAGRSSDLDARVNRYFISMGIRALCFFLAIVVTGPLRWVFISGAIVLPYIAVIMANAPKTSRGSGPLPPPVRAPRSIDASPVGTLPKQASQGPDDAGDADHPNG
jgi:hypothetical protein